MVLCTVYVYLGLSPATCLQEVPFLHDRSQINILSINIYIFWYCLFLSTLSGTLSDRKL